MIVPTLLLTQTKTYKCYLDIEFALCEDVLLLFLGCDSGFGHTLTKKMDSIGMRRVFAVYLVTMSCYYFQGVL